MSEKYPSNQYNLLKQFAEADKKRELEENQKKTDKMLTDLDQEAPDPYGEINPAARNYEFKTTKKKKSSKRKPVKKLSPEQVAARQQEELMRRHYDQR